MSGDAYFPVEAFGKKDAHGDLFAGLYSRHLSSMDEPSLWQASPSGNLHAYRFLWLRTFHQPVAVRLQVEESETGLLIAKVSDGKGGYEPGRLVFNETSRLSRQEVERFIQLLSEFGFWEQPTIEESGGIGIDGARWVLEGLQNGRYHVLSRWSPRAGAFRETALMLLKLAEIKVERIY